MKAQYIPPADELAKLPALEADQQRLQTLLDGAKTAKKELKAVNAKVREILHGPIKKRGPRKPKVKPADPVAENQEVRKITAEVRSRANESIPTATE